MRLALRSLLAGCTALAALACAPRPPHAPAPADAAPDRAWTAAFVRDSGWTGGDGGASLPLADGRTLWLFSDSTIGQVQDGRHAPGTRIVNNSVAVGAEPTGLEFAWGAGEPARALFTPAAEDRWYWMAGGGVDAGGPLVLFVWAMARAGRPGIWDFEHRGTDAVVVENPREAPGAWRWRASPLFGADGGAPGRRRAWGAAVLREGAWAYVYGVDTTENTKKTLLLARVRPARAADASAWEFRTAAGGWSPRAADAAPVAAGATDEFSVQRPRAAGGLLVLVQMEPNLGRRVQVRTAEHPWGPWSPARAVWTCPEPASDPRLMVYSARAHAEVPGEGLLVTYCVNSRDFGHMMGDASVYRPRAVRLPWGLVRGDTIDQEHHP